MKKIILRVVLGIVIVFLLSRIYHFIVLNNVYHAIEEFEREENRYYSVTIISSNTNIIKTEMLVKNKIIKYNSFQSETIIYCDWKDFNNNEEYLIDFINKNFTIDVLLKEKQKFLSNLPKLILDVYKDNKFHMNKFLKIKYIIPITYENEKCYKIVTNLETIIVNRKTYLPIYSSLKFINSNETSKSSIENKYEFKVGGVTDEDIALPDLTGYTNLDEK